MLKQLSEGFLHIFFPRLCVGCRKPLVRAEKIICLDCETLLAKTNYHHIPDNETALRLSGRVPFRHATSLAYFTSDSLLQHLVHGLKYKGWKQTGLFLGAELGKAIKKEHWDIDVIVPVPLHKRKEAARGYNQSWYVAEGISTVLKVPVLDKVVIRTRFTESQTNKSREERVANVQSAFHVVQPERIRGRHVLLTDDVLTTGATVESCALSLLSIPQTSLSIATVGIATG